MGVHSPQSKKEIRLRSPACPFNAYEWEKWGLTKVDDYILQKRKMLFVWEERSNNSAVINDDSNITSKKI